jgi:hypothetical protein
MQKHIRKTHKYVNTTNKQTKTKLIRKQKNKNKILAKHLFVVGGGAMSLARHVDRGTSS